MGKKKNVCETSSNLACVAGNLAKQAKHCIQKSKKRFLLPWWFAMASRDGATVDGTDGSDFAHRERVVSQYYTSAKTKGYLSLTQWFHLFVALVLTAKLSPAILDYFDIFVLALEEQNIPKPLTWEWIWLAGSAIIVLFGFQAMKTSKAMNIQIYMALVFLFGLLPIGWCMIFYFSDLHAYCYEPQSKLYQTWKGWPVSILWYIFAIVAVNVHGCEMMFAYTLKNAWAPKRKMN